MKRLLAALTAAIGIAASALAATVNLSTVTTPTTLTHGDTATGTLAANVKISIADGATVTLSGVSINDGRRLEGDWAGITCLGDATIVLEGANCVVGVGANYPGIYIPSSYAPQTGLCPTLTIKGNGSLFAENGGGWSAAIGGGGINGDNDRCGIMNPTRASSCPWLAMQVGRRRTA